MKHNFKKTDFKPNGCTFFPEGKQSSCCYQHDLDYINGLNRKFADRKLRQCILQVRHEQKEKMLKKTDKILNKLCINIKYIFWFCLTWLMYFGVRCFGWIFYYRLRILLGELDIKEKIKNYLKKILGI